MAGKEIAFPTAGNTTDTGRDGGSGAFDPSVHEAGIEVGLVICPDFCYTYISIHSDCECSSRR